MTDEIEGGWGQAHGSRKWHWYGADRRSLCGKFAWLTKASDLESEDFTSLDNCAACWRKRQAAITKAESQAG